MFYHGTIQAERMHSCLMNRMRKENEMKAFLLFASTGNKINAKDGHDIKSPTNRSFKKSNVLLLTLDSKIYRKMYDCRSYLGAKVKVAVAPILKLLKKL